MAESCSHAPFEASVVVVPILAQVMPPMSAPGPRSTYTLRTWVLLPRFR